MEHTRTYSYRNTHADTPSPIYTYTRTHGQAYTHTHRYRKVQTHACTHTDRLCIQLSICICVHTYKTPDTYVHIDKHTHRKTKDPAEKKARDSFPAFPPPPTTEVKNRATWQYVWIMTIIITLVAYPRHFNYWHEYKDSHHYHWYHFHTLQMNWYYILLSSPLKDVVIGYYYHGSIPILLLWLWVMTVHYHHYRWHQNQHSSTHPQYHTTIIVINCCCYHHYFIQCFFLYHNHLHSHWYLLQSSTSSSFPPFASPALTPSP